VILKGINSQTVATKKAGMTAEAYSVNVNEKTGSHRRTGLFFGGRIYWNWDAS